MDADIGESLESPEILEEEDDPGSEPAALAPPADPFSLGALIAQGECFAVYEQAEPSRGSTQRWVVKRALEPLCTQAAFVERLRWLADKLQVLRDPWRHPCAEEVALIRAEPGDCALVCERLEGQTLADVLQRGVRLNLEDARTVCTQICDALTAAHSLGLAHGNLTPERIVFVRPYEPGSAAIKVRGFGLGRLLGCDLFGTSPYLAPEQVELFSPRPAATPRTDQFVLAALLIEMLTGRKAFAGSTVAEVRHKLLHQDPRQIEWAGAAPDEVRRVHKALERALAKMPEQRYRSLHAFVEALMPRAYGSALAPMSQPPGQQPGQPLAQSLGQPLGQPMPIRLVLDANLQVMVPDMPTLQVRPGGPANPMSGEATLPAIRLEPIQLGQLASSMAGAMQRRSADPNATLPLGQVAGGYYAPPPGPAVRPAPPSVPVLTEEHRMRQRARWVRPLLIAGTLITLSLTLLAYGTVHRPASPAPADGGSANQGSVDMAPPPSPSAPESAQPAANPIRKRRPAAAALKRSAQPARGRTEPAKPGRW